MYATLHASDRPGTGKTLSKAKSTRKKLIKEYNLLVRTDLKKREDVGAGGWGMRVPNQ